MSDEEKVDLGEKNKKKKRIYMTIGIISGIIIIILGVFLNSFTKNYLYNGKIGHNIFVEDVDISHLSKEEAIKQISDKYTPQNLNLKYEDLNFEVKAEDIDYKYNIEDIVKDAYNNKLKNKIFHLLCEYEEDGEWEKFLDSILIELDGFSEEEKTINYYILYKKLSSLRYLRYKYFRPTIFECMSLVGK